MNDNSGSTSHTSPPLSPGTHPPRTTLKMIDLFSGIGGFSLAASWTREIETIQFVEIDKFCQKVLKKNFPGVPIHEDITTFTVDTYVNQWYNRLSQNIKEVVNMGALLKDYDEAVKLYNSGLSIQNVADFYSMSRQSMWMILKRRGCEFRPHLKYGKDNHFYRGGSTSSDKAQNILEEAIEKGIVIRKVICEKCSDTPIFSDGRTGIQAHHTDYNKPLDVVWLCQKCHHEWHKINKAIEKKEVMPSEAIQSAEINIICGGFP